MTGRSGCGRVLDPHPLHPKSSTTPQTPRSHTLFPQYLDAPSLHTGPTHTWTPRPSPGPWALMGGGGGRLWGSTGPGRGVKGVGGEAQGYGRWQGGLRDTRWQCLRFPLYNTPEAQQGSMAHGAWAGSVEHAKLSAKLSPRPVSLERDRAHKRKIDRLL